MFHELPSSSKSVLQKKKKKKFFLKVNLHHKQNRTEISLLKQSLVLMESFPFHKWEVNACSEHEVTQCLGSIPFSLVTRTNKVKNLVLHMIACILDLAQANCHTCTFFMKQNAIV